MFGGTFEMIIVESDILPLFFNIEQLGDLNSDGYDDIAISAPYDETLQYPDYQGKVCIYAGILI